MTEDYVEIRDISVYQWFRNPNGTPIITDPIDPQKMVSQGVKGVYFRALTWRGEEDYAFKLNWNLFKGILPRGAYGFTSTTTPLDHAKKFVNIINSTGDLGELPPWLDYEDPKIIPQPEPADEKETYIWLEYVEENYRRPIIYTSKYMWFKKPLNLTKVYKLAVANYTAALRPTLPIGWTDWYMWQYSAKGDGIAHGVKSKEIDKDRIRKSDWEALTGQHIMSIEEILIDHERRIKDLEEQIQKYYLKQ